MSKIDILCRSARVEIIPTKQRRRARQTHARRVLRRLAGRHGDGHVRQVLTYIVDSTNNAGSLWSEVILAVSDIVLLKPEWSERRALDLMNAFDRINLGQLREEARSLPVSSKRVVLAVMIAERLRTILDPEPQGVLPL